MTTELSTTGDVRIVQFPHPGGEHDMSRRRIREWRLGSAAHRRTFLQVDGQFRENPDGPDAVGGLAAWVEWEAQARLVCGLDPVPGGPKWLCEPVVEGLAPIPVDGSPAQNTDPFVFGDCFRYTACRQPTNRKLRALGRGSLILFGSSVGGDFVLDTVFVVAGYIDHSAPSYHDLPRSVSPDDHRRFTLDPWYGWGDNGTTYRLYLGATPDEPVDGMFSYLPCMPAAGEQSGFARPAVFLHPFVNPSLRMQARSSALVKAEVVSGAWRAVADSVMDAGLFFGTGLTLRSTLVSIPAISRITRSGQAMPDAVAALERSRAGR